jgi:hypothetical protein
MTVNKFSLAFTVRQFIIEKSKSSELETPERNDGVKVPAITAKITIDHSVASAWCSVKMFFVNVQSNKNQSYRMLIIMISRTTSYHLILTVGVLDL